MRGKLIQVNVSNGGMPKRPVPSARVTVDGLEGDWQKNRKYHGGPDRAVCLFSVELYDRLRALGIDLAHGSVGENFTVEGIDFQNLAKGDRLRVGGGEDGRACVVEITDVRVPCRQLKRWDDDLPELIVGYSGWVAKVITEGEARPGDEVEKL